MSTEERTYGPTALLTPANLMTSFRIVVAPLFIYLLIAHRINWWTSLVGTLAAASDYFDGIVARRHGTTIVPAVIITLREIWKSIYRSKASKKGISIPASQIAKWKTFVQDLAIALCVLPFTAHHTWLAFITIWIATLMTVYTGWKYYVDGKKAS